MATMREQFAESALLERAIRENMREPDYRKYEWSPVRLGDLISIKHGWAFKSDFFSEELTGRSIIVNIGNFQYTGGFRFESTTLKEYRDKFPDEYVLKPDDILLVMTCQTAGGEILGIPGCIPDDGRTYLHNQRLGKVVVTRPDKIDEGFLYWVFLWKEFNRELVATATGTKILHTAPQRIESFKFNLPALNEQQTIAHILGTLDDKIELNRRMNETLEAMARALFKSWFVDFDPVRAKAEHRQPAGMDAKTAALFPSSFAESPLGQIPKGWEAGSIGAIGENARRGIRPSDTLPATPYIGLEHMPRRNITLSDWGAADDVTSNKFAFREGDILFGKLRPYFHKVGVAPLDGVCSTDIVVVTPTQPQWFGLLLCHLSSTDFVNAVDAASTGTKMPRTRWQDMARYEVVLPTNPVAEKFTQQVQSLVEMIRGNIMQSRTLAALRDALLPKLLSGEIRVREAEREVEQVA